MTHKMSDVTPRRETCQRFKNCLQHIRAQLLTMLRFPFESKYMLWPCRSSAVRRWLPTAAARVRVRAACGICGGQSSTGGGFIRLLRFPLPIIPPICPLS
jgi:hypothetical protein